MNIFDPCFIYFNPIEFFQYVSQLFGQSTNIIRHISEYFGPMLNNYFNPIEIFQHAPVQKKSIFCPLWRLISFFRSKKSSINVWVSPV